MKIVVRAHTASLGLGVLLLIYLVLLPGCSQGDGIYRILTKIDSFDTSGAVRIQSLQRYSPLRKVLKRALQQQGLRVVGRKFRKSPILIFRKLKVEKTPLTITRYADVGEYRVKVSLIASLYIGPNWVPSRRKFTSSTSFLNSPNKPFVAANEEKEVLVQIYRDLGNQIVDWLILTHRSTYFSESRKTKI